MQKIHVKDKGTLVFDKTFVNNQLHIGKVTGGGYLHLGGQPVKNKDELRSVIPDGPELVEALKWFDNRGKEPDVEKPKKKIVITVDGFAFEDGPINSIQEIMNNTSQGTMQEMVLAWWGGQLKDKEKAKRREISRVARTVDEIRREVAEKGAADRA